jgi:copper chaperone CopZ
VNVALTKLPGVESAEVSLNRSLAIVKLKPGNTISVPQLWRMLRDKGYTPKTTIVSVRGDIADFEGGLQLKVSGTNDMILLAPDPKNSAAWSTATAKVGQRQIVQGTMEPAKDLKVSVPLAVSQVK